MGLLDGLLGSFMGGGQQGAQGNSQLLQIALQMLQQNGGKGLAAPPIDVLDTAALVELARRRPVLVELDTVHVEPASYPALAPDGALYSVRDPSLPLDWPALLARQERRQRSLELHAALSDPDALRLVLWLRYTDALYFAGLGQRAAAVRSLDAARRLYPEDRNVVAMHDALRSSAAERPIDVRPFLRLE